MRTRHDRPPLPMYSEDIMYTVVIRWCPTNRKSLGVKGSKNKKKSTIK